MKLIYCPKCQDMVKLMMYKRTCHCGESFGQYYADALHAEIGGAAIPIGFSNTSFADAISGRNLTNIGRSFTAFVISMPCSTVKRVE